MIRLTLPFPPSVNRIWRTPRKGPLAGKTLLSADARKYRDAVLGAVYEQIGIPPKLGIRLAVTVRLVPPDNRRRDLDNTAKSALDALMHAGVYLDDSQIDDLRLLRCAVRHNSGCAVVDIEPLKVPPCAV